MTTTPKASRFRLGLNRAQKPPAPTATPEPVAQPIPTPQKPKEYSARQLRMARRVAEKKWDQVFKRSGCYRQVKASRHRSF